MKNDVHCVNENCKFFGEKAKRSHIVKHGRFRRKCDSKYSQRFKCTSCLKTFSNQTFNPTYRQHKPRINKKVFQLLCSKVSMRRAAMLLGVDKKTIDKRLKWRAKIARERHAQFLRSKVNIPFIQMDEMETFEHTKCKPLSIAMAVDGNTRQILGVKVSVMPATGHLAEISRRKYGSRIDQRKAKFQSLLKQIKPVVTPTTLILTDKKPAYSRWIREILPKAVHKKTKGRRGCVVGYGELKRGGFDPLFNFNHTAAMNRDNLARLLRRTWCTTKKIQGLVDALSLYIEFHNFHLVHGS